MYIHQSQMFSYFWPRIYKDSGFCFFSVQYNLIENRIRKSMNNRWFPAATTCEQLNLITRETVITAELRIKLPGSPLCWCADGSSTCRVERLIVLLCRFYLKFYRNKTLKNNVHSTQAQTLCGLAARWPYKTWTNTPCHIKAPAEVFFLLKSGNMMTSGTSL